MPFSFCFTIFLLVLSLNYHLKFCSVSMPHTKVYWYSSGWSGHLAPAAIIGNCSTVVYVPIWSIEIYNRKLFRKKFLKFVPFFALGNTFEIPFARTFLNMFKHVQTKLFISVGAPPAADHVGTYHDSQESLYTVLWDQIYHHWASFSFWATAETWRCERLLDRVRHLQPFSANN